MAKWKPKTLTSFSDAQKVAAFDQLRKSAEELLERHQSAIADGAEEARHESDDIFRLGEAVMMLTLGKDVFQKWDKQ